MKCGTYSGTRYGPPVNLRLYAPIPSRYKRYLTTGDLPLGAGSILPPEYLIHDSVEFAKRSIHIEWIEIPWEHAFC